MMVINIIANLIDCHARSGGYYNNIEYIHSIFINMKLTIFVESIPWQYMIKIINVYYTYTMAYINMDSAVIYFCTFFTPESLETCKLYPSCMCLPVHIFKTIYWGNFNIILLLNIDLSFPSVALFEFSFSFISLMFFV